ncbi:cytochrome P450 52E1 [Coprinopsis cinerea okayama7|uniref:Cytochrome P450 52E1 n=1 Tax=Coprinopsis cinerea (strain Okayama-7 / 130 / ATCC MYA-4618 / FGSC 9003) TaxID=240176 RepID=A8P1V8_COPC7|nr:cytochrome P450 52E1 [Coprinopsis cinerea okayama7\|eukprot:XP_001838184.2 cytochrome P450 52E1 [Coprinopsis cinerea okayama7\
MNPAYYRVRVLLDVCHSFLLPIALVHLVLFWFELALPRIQLVLIYVGSVVLCSAAKTFYNDLTQCRELRQHLRPIPRVVGRWPGNLDILLRMMKDFKTSYVLDVYLQLFKEYQCTTLNLRILWRDCQQHCSHRLYILSTAPCHVLIHTTLDHIHGSRPYQIRPGNRVWALLERSCAERTIVRIFGNGTVHETQGSQPFRETFLGSGIFNRDDDDWKEHRAIARPFFARDRIEDFDNFETHTARTLSILTSLASTQEAFDAQDLYSRFTLDSASEFLFGKNLDTLSQSRPIPGQTVMGPKGSAVEGDWGSFAKAFETAQINATTRARIGHWWPLLELFKDKNAEHADVIHRWLDPLVQRALNERTQRIGRKRADSKASLGTSFLKHIAECVDDPVTIRDQLLNMLLASRDTTATVLTFLTYLLATHPDVTDRLRAEILEHVGPTSHPFPDTLKQLKYLRAVLNETMRLYPPVPLNIRETRSASCTLPPSDPTYASSDTRPFYMPAKTIIIAIPLCGVKTPKNSFPNAG